MEELRADDPTRIGPYTLTARLGAGGMGQVFLGESLGGRLVAVKVIHPELARDTEFRVRFAREVAVARTVGGFFTVPVVDADSEAAQPWLATGYVDGPSLDDAVTEHGPMPESSLMTLAAGLAEGLAAIHAAGIVHRDLKPSNVLLAQDGVRVIDFGIARAADRTTVTGTGRLIGTVGFMSPEQTQSARVGSESDVFSMGGVLAFAASGEDPFGRGTAPQLLFRVVYESPRLDRVPDKLRDLITWCMDKDPVGRPTARQFLEALPPVLHARQPGTSRVDWWPTQVAVTASPPREAREPGRVTSHEAPATPACAEPAVLPASTGPAVLPAPTEQPTLTRQQTWPTHSLQIPSPTDSSSPLTDPGPVQEVPRVTGATDKPLVRRPRRRRWTIAGSVLGAVVLVLGVIVFASYEWTQGKSYLGVQNGEVTIFQGINSSVAGISLSSPYQNTGLPLSQLPDSDQQAIRATVEYSDLKSAQAVVNELKAQVGDCHTQWSQLVSWQRQDAAYQVALDHWVHLSLNQRAQSNQPTFTLRQPKTPVSNACAPASAFGITAAQLPPGTTNTTS